MYVATWAKNLKGERIFKFYFYSINSSSLFFYFFVYFFPFLVVEYLAEEKLYELYCMFELKLWYTVIKNVLNIQEDVGLLDRNCVEYVASLEWEDF